MNKSLQSSMDGRHLAKLKEQARQSEHDVNMIIEESKESDASGNGQRKRTNSQKTKTEKELMEEQKDLMR